MSGLVNMECCTKCDGLGVVAALADRCDRCGGTGSVPDGGGNGAERRVPCGREGCGHSREDHAHLAGICFTCYGVSPLKAPGSYCSRWMRPAAALTGGGRDG